MSVLLRCLLRRIAEFFLQAGAAEMGAKPIRLLQWSCWMFGWLSSTHLLLRAGEAHGIQVFV